MKHACKLGVLALGTHACRTAGLVLRLRRVLRSQIGRLNEHLVHALFSNGERLLQGLLAAVGGRDGRAGDAALFDVVRLHELCALVGVQPHATCLLRHLLAGDGSTALLCFVRLALPWRALRVLLGYQSLGRHGKWRAYGRSAVCTSTADTLHRLHRVQL